MSRRTGEIGGVSLGWLRDKRVLLAEDNVTNQMVATQMLDALGARVEVANDGAEALEMINAYAYDLYLIDIEMPRVSGLEVIRAIREAEAPLRDAPVLAVTAYALREHREKIAEAGADGLIPKPLIGIEQFGRDIVTMTHRARERMGAYIAPDPEEPKRPRDFEDRPSARSAPSAASEPQPAAAPSKPTAPPVVMEVFNGLKDAIGAEAMADLLQKIDGDLDRVANELRAGVDASSATGVSNATHVLISVSGAIGAESLRALAQRLNGAAHGKTDDDIAALSSEVSLQIMVLRSFLKAQLIKAGA